jgi:hypothetical protein
MRKIASAFILIFTLSCGEKTDENTSSSTSSDQIVSTPDFNVAINFINDYALFCTPNSPEGTDTNWVRNHSLLTDSFKTNYYNLMKAAREEDSEFGLGFDPIFDAQDFPDKGFEIASSDAKTGFVTVKSKDWPDFVLILRVVQHNGTSFVDGSGIINIPNDKRAKR